MKANTAREPRTAWDDGDPVLARAVSRLQAHPQFAPAVRALAGHMLALFDSDEAVAGIIKDAGRYVAAMVAASMRHDGVTLARLKETCASFGLLSRGRAHALLVYLHYLGYVRLGPKRGLHSVTPAFADAWRLHYAAALQAAALIDPIAADMAARLEEIEWLDRFTDAQLAGLRESVPALSSMGEIATLLLDRHGGSPLLWTLLIHAQWEQDRSRPVVMSGAALAERVGVSRMHMSRMLRSARAAGLIMQPATATIQLTPRAHAQIAQIYGMQLARLLVSCERVTAG